MLKIKQYFTLFLISFILLTTLSGCEFIGDVFEVGVWTGIIIVVLFIALVIWLLKKIF